MEANFQTSFIPKKPVVAERASASRPFGFFSIVSILILFTVLLATGGLFFYKVILAKNIVQMENDLTLAKNRFEPSKLEELKLLDRRLHASSKILSNHIAVTPVFQSLSAVTLKTVRYTDFSYSLEEDENGKGPKVIVRMKGLAVGYRSIALQSDLFAGKEEGKNFIEPVFSNLKLDNSGNVLFDLEFSVDPAFVNYKTALSTESQV